MRFGPPRDTIFRIPGAARCRYVVAVPRAAAMSWRCRALPLCRGGAARCRYVVAVPRVTER